MLKVSILMSLILFSAASSAGYEQSGSQTQELNYQCPKGWDVVYPDGPVYCRNPRTGALLAKLHTGEVIKIRNGQRDKYCRSGWVVAGSVHLCW